MKETTLSEKQRYFLFVLGLLVIFYSAFFILSYIRADILFKKAVSKNLPSLKLEKIDYYREIFFLISQAIILRKDNADYYAQKADYLLEASGDEIEEELALNSRDVEKLYIKAIKINPVDFKYHLKLGWFYENQDKKKAEKELKKAVSLYPTGYQGYLYLGKHYLRSKEEWLAFKNFILSLHCAQNWWDYSFKVMKLVEEDIKNSSHIFLDKKKRIIKYILNIPSPSQFDFGEEGFPHAKIPLKVRVYIDNGSGQVSLYKDSLYYAQFNRVDKQDELLIYEIDLDYFPSDVFLDKFKIKTEPPLSIKKIEILKHF